MRFKAVSGGRRSSTEDELSWEDLNNIERRRRAILRRSDLPFYRLLLFWDGTCLRLLARDPLLWLTIIIYAGVRIQYSYGTTDFVIDVGVVDIGVIGGFLSFFLVFFVIQSNQRFDKLYGFSMSCEGRIFDVATLSKGTDMPQERMLRLVRYLNAAHMAGYCGLSDTYTKKNFFKEINKTNRVLSATEYGRVNQLGMDTGGSCYRELIAWCIMEVQDAFKLGMIDRELAGEIRTNILKLRASLGALYDFADQPVSFFYLHLISLLSALYLPLFSIKVAYDAGKSGEYWTSDVVACLFVIVQSIFVIGLRLLGQKMSDPYGEDLEDLSVLHYVNFTWLMSNRIIKSKRPQPIDRSIEERICQARVSLGKAWEGTELEEKDNMLASYSDTSDESAFSADSTEPKVEVVVIDKT